MLNQVVSKSLTRPALPRFTALHRTRLAPQRTPSHRALPQIAPRLVAETRYCEAGGPPMPLSARTRLGPYETLAALGAGEMGEVHKARPFRAFVVVSPSC